MGVTASSVLKRRKTSRETKWKIFDRIKGGRKCNGLMRGKNTETRKKRGKTFNQGHTRSLSCAGKAAYVVRGETKLVNNEMIFCILFLNTFITYVYRNLYRPRPKPRARKFKLTFPVIKTTELNS